MTLFDAVVLGIVEGLSEFLPVSSTGHLILASQILKIPESDFLKSFDIAIQLGAIFSVVLLYFKTLLVDWHTVRRLIAAFIPTGVIGILAYPLLKRFLLGNASVVLWSLLLGGAFLIVFERLYREKAGDTGDIRAVTYRQAVWIGVFQAVAIIPGVSRSAATILGGLSLGLKRKTIVEFSFLLAVPTMLAATVLDLSKSMHAFSPNEFGLLGAGFVTSFVVALAAIKFFLRFIQNHNFTAFGIYRILIALLFFLFAK